MASRSAATAAASLTDEDLAALRAALTEGRKPTVYLREPIPTLDVPEGASAKVQSIDGRTLAVKPRRVDDELSYEAEELRMTRKAPVAPAKAAAKRTGSKGTGGKGAGGKGSAPAAAKSAAANSSAAKGSAVKAGAAGAAAKAGAAKAGAPSATQNASVTSAAGPAPKSAAGRAAEPSASRAPTRSSTTAPQRRSRRRRGSDAVTVTIQGAAADAPHEWTVTVVGGGARSAKPVPVRAESVVQAVGALNVPAAAKAVDAVLESARAQAEQRVEELARELAEAKKALRSLGK